MPSTLNKPDGTQPLSQQPDYLSLIYRRLEQIEAQMRSLKTAVMSLEDYAELLAAASTERAKEIRCAEGFTGPKQLLLAALRNFLELPVYMSEEEERQFIETRDRILAARAYPSGNS
jgi:hypothetical protein